MATPRKKPEDKLKTGRPTAFKPEFIEQAHKLALLGLKDQQMAEVFGVAVRTLDYWKIHHPAFLQAINNGKAPSDALVAASQLKRANGFTQRVSKPMVVNGKIKIIKYDEYFPPSDTAGIFWLKNRQRQIWRDVLRQENTGADGGAIKTETTQTVIIDASKMDPDARTVLREALKAAKG